MADNQPDDNNGLLGLLKKLWLPVAGFIGAVTLVYNFYRLWLGDKTTITYITAVALLITLTVLLLSVGLSKETIIHGKKVRTEPRYSKTYRQAAFALLGILWFGAGISGWLLYKDWRELNNKLIVVIANFGGPEDIYGLRDELFENLSTNFKDNQKVEIIGVDEIITSADGRDKALELGTQKYADIVMWGWYRSTENPNLTLHIENLSPQFATVLDDSSTFEPNVTLAELETFEFQQKLGGDTSALINFLIGLIEYQAGDYFSSISPFNKSIDALESTDSSFISRRALAYYYRGNAHYYVKQYDQAIIDLSKAFELDSQFAFAVSNRGSIYAELGEYNEAVTDFSKAIQLDPKDAFSYNNRGIVYRKLKQYDEAIADYTKAIQLDPEYVFAYNNRGVAHADQEQYDLAIADYSKAIKLDPRHTAAYSNRGNVYAILAKYDQAIADYSKAIQLNPQFANAYYGRGFVYKLLGNATAAEVDFKKYEELTGEKAP